jgi:hypothetical protein
VRRERLSVDVAAMLLADGGDARSFLSPPMAHTVGLVDAFPHPLKGVGCD